MVFMTLVVTVWAAVIPAQSRPPALPKVERTAPGAAAPGASVKARSLKSKFNFEFSKAEVTDIVKAISDITQKNFIIPDRLRSQRITILSPTPVTVSEAYQIFYTALAANNISIVRSGKFYKLIDSKDSMRDSVPTCVEDGQTHCSLNTDQMVTVLVRLHNTDAVQINTVARTLLSKDGDIAVFQPSNALIISEYAPNLRRIRHIIEALDVPGFDDELQLVYIQYANATEIADKLTQIFEIQRSGPQAGPRVLGGPRRFEPNIGLPRPGGPAGTPGGMDRSQHLEVQISKIVPDERTNQLIIKANRRSFDAIKNLITKLDVPLSETEQGRMHVYYLENTKAEDLASTLSSLTQGQSGQNTRGAMPNRPALIQAALNQSQANAKRSASLFEGDVKITADKTTNALLIMASIHDFRALRSLIEKLDVVRRQVYVEAAILEVNLNDNKDAGISWHVPNKFDDKGLKPLQNAIGFLQNSDTTSGGSPTLGALANTDQLLQTVGGAVAGIIGPGMPIAVGNTVITVPSFGMILKWLQRTSNANILSTPYILTKDNEQAHIEVGSKIPFNTGIFGGGLGALGGLGTQNNPALGGLGGMGLAGLTSQIQRIDVSLKLTMTPQINEHNKIRMDIEQTIEDVIGEESKTQTPTTAHRSIKTVVVVDDQQTIVLGGLMRDRTTDSESKVPIISSVPVIGPFFKTRHSKVEKVSLLLVLTPYIISSPYDFQRIFERKLREHEEFAAEYYGHRKEYRAFIDYSKKVGPLAHWVSVVRHHRERFENGGHGDGTQILIEPQKKQDAAVNPSPKLLPSEADGSSGSPEEGAQDSDEGDKQDAEGQDNPFQPEPESDTGLAPPVLDSHG